MPVTVDHAWQLTDEQRSIAEMAERFCDERIVPAAGDWDREHRFPEDVVAELGELGLMGVSVPTEHGGSGADCMSAVLALEHIARGDAGLATTVLVQNTCTSVLVEQGSDEQVERWVPDLAAGRKLIAFGFTEAEAGSDTQAIRTTASGGRISGTKQWCTNGSFAAVYVIGARDRDADDRVSLFLVEREAPGFEVTREEEKLGLHSSSTADLVLEDTPGEYLGEPGKGVNQFLHALVAGRIYVAALATGLAQAAFDVALEYAKQRRAFGRPIGAFQAIQQKLADMQTEIEAARAMTWRAARMRDAGRTHVIEASQAKLFASGVARRQTGEAIQVLGGAGYTREFPAERFYRDAKITEIYEGTSEIQRLVIARAMLGEVAREDARG